MSAIDDLIHEGPVPIDGGFATELEALDYDLTSDLWSARLLQDGPAAVEAVHLNFLRAGARVSITASYQASQESFATAGIPAAEADRLIATSVTLAQAARTAFEGERPAAPFTLVAASLGPYGAMLANGQEYTGDYEGAGVDEIAAFHRPRVAALLGAVPLAMGTGVGSELRRPLGVTIIGGLLVSQLLTLYTTPIVFVGLEALRAKVLGPRVPASSVQLPPMIGQTA